MDGINDKDEQPSSEEATGELEKVPQEANKAHEGDEAAHSEKVNECSKTEIAVGNNSSDSVVAATDEDLVVTIQGNLGRTIIQTKGMDEENQPTQKCTTNVIEDVELEERSDHVNPNEDELQNLSKGYLTGMRE